MKKPKDALIGYERFYFQGSAVAKGSQIGSAGRVAEGLFRSPIRFSLLIVYSNFPELAPVRITRFYQALFLFASSGVARESRPLSSRVGAASDDLVPRPYRGPCRI